MRDYRLKIAVFANEPYGVLRTYFRDGIQVVATKEDTEVDKLILAISRLHSL